MNNIYKLFNFKKNNDNKGYTLIELIAVILVLSIIISIVINFGMNVINNVKKKSYNITINNIENEASNYVLEYMSNYYWEDINDSNDQYTCVIVNDLIDAGYFKYDVLDSYIDNNIKVNKNDQIYIQRNKSNKNIVKEILLVGDSKEGYENLCTFINNKPVTDEFNIKYDPNGGNGSMEDTKCKYGEICILSKNTFVNDDNIFLGWSEDKNSKDAVYGDEYEFDSFDKKDDMILYAIWRKQTLYAIYSDSDKSLRFYNNNDKPEVGDIYRDKVVTKIYTDFENVVYKDKNSIPWYDVSENVTQVVVEEAVIPLNISYWFNSLVNCSSLNLTKLNTLKITDMNFLFNNTGNNVTTSFDIVGLNNWDVSNVIDMNGMFQRTGTNAINFNIGDLSGWDVSNVTDMSYMFYATGMKVVEWNIGKLNDWKVSNVTNMKGMFGQSGFKSTSFDIGNLSKWDVSNVTDMSGMFAYAGNSAENFDIGDLSKWDVSNVTNMNAMFNQAGNSAENFNIGKLNDWKVSNVTNMGGMFHGCGINTSSFDIGDLSEWDVSNVTDMNNMFRLTGFNAEVFKIGDISSWDTKNVIDMSYMFENTAEIEADWFLNLSSWNVSKVKFYTNFNNWVTTKVKAPNWVN